MLVQPVNHAFASWAYIVGAITVVLLVATWMKSSGRPSLVTWATLSIGILFALRPIFVSLKGYVPRTNLNVQSQFTYAVQLGLMAMCATWFGWLLRGPAALRIALPPKKKLTSEEVSRLRTATNRLSLLFVGLLAALAAFAGPQGLIELTGARVNNGLVDRLPGILALAPSMGAPLACLYVLIYRHPPFRGIYLFAALTCISVPLIFSVRAGGRLILLLAVAPPIWLFYRTRSKRLRPRRVAVLALILLAIPLANGFREGRNSDKSLSVSMVGAFGAPGRQFTAFAGSQDLEMFEGLATMAAVVPKSVPYQHGSVIVDTVVRFIPRQLWHSKPSEANDRLNDLLYPDVKSRAGTAFSFVGAGYLDSGPLGVIILGLAFGLALRRADHLSQSYLTGDVVYAFSVALTIILVRGTVADTCSRILVTLLPILLVDRFVRRADSASDTVVSLHGSSNFRAN